MNSISDLELVGKRVLARVDFNVLMDAHGNITDGIRIQMILPTLQLIVDKGGKLVICSHMGRKVSTRCRCTNSVVPIK